MSESLVASNKSPLLRKWEQASRFPLGRWLFGKLIGLVVPYASSIRPRIESLSAGYAKVSINDRRAVHNHIKSIHAAALIHLAETTANLALMSRQPKAGRWIVTGMEVSFLKKARGTILADLSLPELDWSCAQDVAGQVTLRDAKNDVVMTATQRWKIEPMPG